MEEQRAADDRVLRYAISGSYEPTPGVLEDRGEKRCESEVNIDEGRGERRPLSHELAIEL